MLILGVNAYHGDSSACLLRNGEIIAAAEEERFTRIKHWAGFPQQAIRYCLEQAGEDISAVEYTAVNRDPWANFPRKVCYALTKSIRNWGYLRHRAQNAVRVGSIQQTFREAFPGFRAQIVHVPHHLAHLASSFFLSGMDEAALCSVDGCGDFVSTMTGWGKGNKIRVFHQVYYPHSLGFFYQAITQFLGFPKYGDEYKVMGLSSYGEPSFVKEMAQIVRLSQNGLFQLSLDFFRHDREGVSMNWQGEPHVEALYSEKMATLLGPARFPKDTIEDRHRDIAASMQKTYEDAFFRILAELQKKGASKNLCLAGGCAMNSVANGKIFDHSDFREVFIHPAAGDSGGSIGAAYYVYNQVLHQPRVGKMVHAYLGPGYSQQQIDTAIQQHQELQENLAGGKISLVHAETTEQIAERGADLIAAEKVVGWFQGRMEWGPRALGNRSILADPRQAKMKEILNDRIKRREPFRPFAPAILREALAEYFETDYEVPFMLMVFQVREEKRPLIPAVTHVDGTGRLQTVSREENPLYYQLIEKFAAKTGIPVVLNTSFNENEPIVCSPDEAIECFLRTKMDALVIGQTILERVGS